MKIEKNILIRPIFIKTVLESVNISANTMSFGKLFHVSTIREQVSLGYNDT